MALLRYLNPIDGLPDPKGPLTSYISAQAIAEANKEVQKATSHSLLPANTTDLLQPMDISVNKPAKDFLKRQFNQWYTEQVMKQLEGRDDDLEAAELQPIEMGMPIMKEISAKWLVDLAEYMSDNPQIIVNGFIRSGIPGAVDGLQEDRDSGNESSQEEYRYTSYESDTSEETIILI